MSVKSDQLLITDVQQAAVAAITMVGLADSASPSEGIPGLETQSLWLDQLILCCEDNDDGIAEFNGYTPPTDESLMGEFQKFYRNQEKLKPENRIAYLLMVASNGVVPGCCLNNEPYASCQKMLKKRIDETLSATIRNAS